MGVISKLFAVFGSGGRPANPAAQFLELEELVKSGAFAALPDEIRKNKTVRIGQIGRQSPAVAAQALALLEAPAKDALADIRYEAAFGALSICKENPQLRNHADRYLTLLKADPDPQVRVILNFKTLTF